MWPLVNGQALLSGINLKTQEVSDMLDLLHFLYEQDAIPLYEEHLKIKSRVRVAMWQNLLEKDYPYPFDESASVTGTPSRGLPPEESLLPPEPGMGPKPPTKPFIPPTSPEDLGAVLDAPLG